MCGKLKVLLFLILPVVFVTSTGCSQEKPTPVSTSNETITGILQSDLLDEISGVAVSAQYPGILYVHNDSGDSSRFFAIDLKGNLLCSYKFEGISNNSLGVMDCEDIAIGPGPKQYQAYIYLADIGDNDASRTSIQVYRFAEPTNHEGRAAIDAATLDLTYPDGAKDAETLLIDPVEKMLYIISKREDSASVYRSSLDFQDKDKKELEFFGKFFLEGKGIEKWIVSGSIASDGSGILLKTVSSVYYWKRQGNEPIYTTLKRAPVKQTAYKMHGQEEAVSFTPDGNGYYILAEGKASTIYYYKLQ